MYLYLYAVSGVPHGFVPAHTVQWSHRSTVTSHRGGAERDTSRHVFLLSQRLFSSQTLPPLSARPFSNRHIKHFGIGLGGRGGMRVARHRTYCPPIRGRIVMGYHYLHHPDSHFYAGLNSGPVVSPPQTHENRASVVITGHRLEDEGRS